jgi:hypothetical protein
MKKILQRAPMRCGVIFANKNYDLTRQTHFPKAFAKGIIKNLCFGHCCSLFFACLCVIFQIPNKEFGESKFV